MTLSRRHLVAVVGILGVVLFTATAALSRLHEEALTARVDEHLRRAHTSAEAGALDTAVAEYRAALSLDRDHPEAARGLALGLVALGRLVEADSYLRNLLAQSPTDGRLQRGLARVHRGLHRPAEARAAYQRAIYGEWEGDDEARQRLATRLELIDYLGTIDARIDVLPELLRVQQELPKGDTVLARRVANQLREHEALDAAVAVLAEAARQTPRDAALLIHLADLQVAAGDAAQGRATLRQALTLAPGDADAQQRLAVVDRVLALDPTLPSLRLPTRTRRSRALLAAVVAQIAPCASGMPTGVEAARAEAAKRLQRRAAADADAAEREQALAVALWTAAPGCHSEAPEAQAIAQVVARVATLSEPAS